MAGYTQEEIAKEVNMNQKTVDNHLEVLVNLEKFPKLLKLSALFQDPDFQPPLYNLWSYGKLTNGWNILLSVYLCISRVDGISFSVDGMNICGWMVHPL